MSNSVDDKSIRAPNRCVGLHAHSGFSIMDGLGYPASHIDWIVKNGMDSWALTDHGNGSGLAHAHSHSAKLKKKGINFRQLNGVEFYFVPSLKQWAIQHQNHKDEVVAARAEKKSKEIIDIDADAEADSGHVIENEDETKDISSIGIKDDEWKRRYHLVVVAKNQKGLSNLFTLVKRSFREGFYRFPRIDFDMLKEHGEGLIVSTACVGGLFSSRILRGQALNKSDIEIQKELLNLSDRFVDAVGNDNFNLEIQFNKLGMQHDVNRHLIKLSQEHNLNLVATCDSHYPSPDKWEARELYKKLAWMNGKEEPKPLPKFEELKCELYPKNSTQMWEEYLKHLPEHEFYKGTEEIVCNAIERTHDIAWRQCEDVWIDTSAKLHSYGTSESSAFKQLVILIKEKLEEQGFSENKEYIDRVKEELEVIKAKSFENYFLILYKIFNIASKKTILGCGRGSGTGSLVNYLLGVTHVDPIKYGLLFSRFINMGRKGFPDVDTDAGDRNALIDAAVELFGEESVIPVSNFNTLKLKSLIKDVAKFYNVPFEEVNQLTGPLQANVEPLARGEDVEKSVFVLTHDDCLKYSPDYSTFMEKYPDVERHISTLFFEQRSIGTHAGGVLICPGLEKHMPIIGVRGRLQTSWTEGMNFRNLEDNGFLKFDFLGLTLLLDIENCIRRILQNAGNKNPSFSDITKFFDDNLNCRYNTCEDQRVYDYVFKGTAKTGVFQFTNEGARKFCSAAKPTTIDELAVITAIYRPGPLKANVHKKYVEAVNSGKSDPIIDTHPIIKEVLGPTRGFIVFQESWMVLAQKLSGFTAVEADEMRKTLVKKSLDTNDKKADEKIALREKFVKGAKAINDLSEKISNELFDKIEFFSLYGFSKNHSIPYVVGSYYAGWLHTHYEKEWLATILQSETGNPKGLSKAIAEIKQHGYKFSQVDINHSGIEWLFSETLQAFVAPLTSVKGVGSAAVAEIFEYRPYHSIKDLLYNEDGSWKHSKFGKGCFESLIMVEAFSSLSDFSNGNIKNHKQLYSFVIESYDDIKKSHHGMSKTAAKKYEKEHGRFPDVFRDLLPDILDIEDWSRAEKISHAVELLTAAPEDLVFPQEILAKIAKSNVDSIFDIEPGAPGICWFCITAITKKVTKKGKEFHIFDVLDDKSRIERLRVWGQFKHVPQPYTLWLAEIERDPQWGPSTMVSKLRKLEV